MTYVFVSDPTCFPQLSSLKDFRVTKERHWETSVIHFNCLWKLYTCIALSFISDEINTMTKTNLGW